jgi:hypothetical protein
MSQEALEALGLDQLVEDGALAFRREGDVLVRALDALLDPGLLVGVGDVHELDADACRSRCGAGWPGSRARVAVLQAQHVIDEDRPVNRRRR